MQTRVAWPRLRHGTRLLSQLQPQVIPFSPRYHEISEEVIHRDARAIAVGPGLGTACPLYRRVSLPIASIQGLETTLT